MSKSNWLVSLTPTISVRESEDGKSILRFIAGYNPDCNVALILIRNDKLELLHGFFNDKAGCDLSQVIDYVVDTCHAEQRAILQVSQYGRFNITYVRNGLYHLYLGYMLVATVVLDDRNEFKVTLAQCYKSLPTVQIYDVAVKLIKESKYYRDPELVTLRAKVMGMINRLSKEDYLTLRLKLGLGATELKDAPQVVSVSHSGFLEQIVSVLEVFFLSAVSVSNFMFFPPRNEYDDHDDHVYISAAMGENLSKAYSCLLGNNFTRFCFIATNPEMTVTEFFLKAFLKDIVLESGTEEAFFNRYSFIGFDHYTDLIKSAVRNILNEHYSRSK